MRLTIAKVDETVFSGEAYSATLPTAAGEMTILGSHMPLVTTLRAGTIRVRVGKDDEPKEFEVKTGVLEVTPEGAVVLL